MIVLDTHAWIWWVSEPGRLTERGRELIDISDAIGISPMSCWEVATKAARGRLQLDRPTRNWVCHALARPRTRVLDFTPDIAVAAAELGRHGLHGDPADRIIAATAAAHGAVLLTKDRKLRASELVATAW